MAEPSDNKRGVGRPAKATESDRFDLDARNQITVISARVQLLRRRLDHGSLDLADLDRALRQIQRATERLTFLINQRDGER